MNCTNSFGTISEYIQYFKDNINYPRPLAKLFKTDSCYYIYDTGTSKIMNCNELEYRILEKIINNTMDEIDNTEISSEYSKYYEALDNIKNAIDSEHILKAGNNLEFNSPGHHENLYDMLENGVRQIVLELTEKCNLRCGYCIYNEAYTDKRNFGSQDMTKDIAKKAIDYAGLHGDKDAGIAITFYGGEPLIKFDLIKYCIGYAQTTIKDRQVRFSMTTNLTLMTEEIAQYLASIKDLSIVCSIDGPKNIHDSYRKDINGVGSFERAIKGLKILVQALGDSAKDRLVLSMVFGKPYSIEKLIQIHSFFNKLEWLPSQISKFITYPSLGNIDYKERRERKEKEKINEDDKTKIFDPLSSWSKDLYFKEIDHNQDIDFFSKVVIEQPLIKIHQRPIYKDYNESYSLNGCCVPGSRKLYITTKGDFMVCERIDGSPIIGDVDKGVNKEKVKRILVDEFSDATINDCKNCWASRLCNLCYAQCYTNGKLDMEKKRYNCNSSRDYMLKNLVFYHKCLESNPKKLEYLGDIKVVV
jgi:uncharacterized protein